MIANDTARVLKDVYGLPVNPEYDNNISSYVRRTLPFLITEIKDDEKKEIYQSYLFYQFKKERRKLKSPKNLSFLSQIFTEDDSDYISQEISLDAIAYENIDIDIENTPLVRLYDLDGNKGAVILYSDAAHINPL